MVCKENAEKDCKSYPNCEGCAAHTVRTNATGKNLIVKHRFAAKTYKDGEYDNAINLTDHDMVWEQEDNHVWASGEVTDRLHEFEKLGYEPEQLERIIKLWRVYRQMAHSQYGTIATKRNVPVDMKNMFDVIDSVNEELVKKIMEQPAITQPVDYRKVWVTTSSSIKDDDFIKKVKEVAEKIDWPKKNPWLDFKHQFTATFHYRDTDAVRVEHEKVDWNKKAAELKKSIDEMYEYPADDGWLETCRKPIRSSEPRLPITDEMRDYIKYDCEYTMKMLERRIKPNMTVTKNPEYQFKIKKVLFNNPATIVFWADGDKTVVKCQNGEPYDPEKGLSMAIAKKALGNDRAYYNVFNKFCKNRPSEVAHLDALEQAYEDLDNARYASRWAYELLEKVYTNPKSTKAELIEAINLALGGLYSHGKQETV